MQTPYESYVAFCKQVGTVPLSQSEWEKRTQISIHYDHIEVMTDYRARMVQRHRTHGHS